jgi:hypothetical protein
MIADATILEEQRKSWNGVRVLYSKIHVAWMASMVGSSAAIFIGDAVHNLPFLHACAVLNDVLEQLAKEQPFQDKNSGTRYKGRELGRLIAASESVLSWENLPLIWEAVKRRNDLAHHADIVPRDGCKKYIDAIEAELVRWGIVPPP